MTYALVKDGKVVSTVLPEIGELPDGAQVSGFDKLDEETLKTAGWYPVQDAGYPDFDPETQTIERTYTISGETVIAHYVVQMLPEPVPPEPEQASVQEQLNALSAILVAKGTISQAEASKLREKPVTPKP